MTADGLLVRVGRNTRIETPLLVHARRNLAGTMAHDRGVIVLEEVQNAISSFWPGLVFSSLPQVKFVSPLLPGEWAEMELIRTEASQFDFRVTRDGALIASGKVRT